MVVRVFKFRLYPTREQSVKLNQTLDVARGVYNKQLGLKIDAYRRNGVNLRQFDLNNHLVSLKEEDNKLRKVHSQVLQNVNQRICWAFNHFYRRVKNGEKPGYPRFKRKNRYDSVTYPQSGFSLGEKLYLSKLGKVNIVKHRKMKGKVKTLTIRKTSTNKWYACFSVEKDLAGRIKSNRGCIGIDLGLLNFYADSEGGIVENPKYYRIAEERLAVVQRQHSKKRKGSKNRIRLRLKVARLHEKISNQRSDFLHKQSRILAGAYSLIAVEKLQIKNMIKNRYLSKSISDVSWRKFLQLLSYKVEETGGKLVEVDPRGTSQYCTCGNRVQKSLAVRVHRCNKCGIRVDRDVMSARVIRSLAFAGSTVGRTGINAWGNESLLSSMNQESQHITNKILLS